MSENNVYGPGWTEPNQQTTCGTVDSVRYLSQLNIAPVQQTVNNYRREQIQQYGIKATYFRSNANWFQSAGPGDAQTILDRIYGEAPNATYYAVKDMIIYMDVTSDNMIMSRIGYETDTDVNFFMNMDEFQQTFRDSLGWNACETVMVSVSAAVKTWAGTLCSPGINLSGSSATYSRTLNYNDFHVYCCSQLIDLCQIQVTQSYGDGTFKMDSTKKHDFIYLPGIYDNACQIFGYTLSGTIPISCSVQTTGCGIISGTLCGTVRYKTKFNDNGMILRPMEQDFFRIQFDEYNRLDFEITRVVNRKLTTDGLNPLLKRYDWQVMAVRRDYSFEPVCGANGTEWLSQATKEELTAGMEKVSDCAFNYEEPGDAELISNILNPDTVYGGYGPTCCTTPVPTPVNPPAIWPVYCSGRSPALCTGYEIETLCQQFKLGPGKIY